MMSIALYMLTPYKGTVIIMSLIKKIPGFRSGKWWKMLIAIPVYSLLLLGMLAFLTALVGLSPPSERMKSADAEAPVEIPIVEAATPSRTAAPTKVIYNIGETASFTLPDNYNLRSKNITVIGVRYTDVIGEGRNIATAGDGKRYVILKLKIENTDPAQNNTNFKGSWDEFELKGTGVWDTYSVDSATQILTNRFTTIAWYSDGSWIPDEYLVFEVPADAIRGLKLNYIIKDSKNKEEKITFKLN